MLSVSSETVQTLFMGSLLRKNVVNMTSFHRSKLLPILLCHIWFVSYTSFLDVVHNKSVGFNCFEFSNTCISPSILKVHIHKFTFLFPLILHILDIWWIINLFFHMLLLQDLLVISVTQVLHCELLLFLKSFLLQLYLLQLVLLLMLIHLWIYDHLWVMNRGGVLLMISTTVMLLLVTVFVSWNLPMILLSRNILL